MHFKDLRFSAVSNMQIITALNANIDVEYATGNLYEKQQNVANEARKRGLLINPNPFGRTGYGDTSVMRPSMTGWEQIKGIQRRVLDIVPNVPITRD